MKSHYLFAVTCSILTFSGCSISNNSLRTSGVPSTEQSQTPQWSRQDLDFFLHGSMSTEFVPQRVLRAFIACYPEMFGKGDLTVFGLIADPDAGIPIGLSEDVVPHLGGMPSLGINCAACHVGEVVFPGDGHRLRVLGMTSGFDAEAFFGAVIGGTFLTADPAKMKTFLREYLASTPLNLSITAKAQRQFDALWSRQEKAITAAIKTDPGGSAGVEPGALHKISAAELRFDPLTLNEATDLAGVTKSFLRLFHNMRAALHIPDEPPAKAPPASGPGRNDAFGLLSALFFHEPQPYAPVKYGLVWNLENRHWVHWDGNTQSPIGRNLLAALGLGAPMLGRTGQLDFAQLQRHTRLSETIRPPKYPFAIDTEAARRGAIHYQTLCASCHDGAEGDGRLYAVQEVGTEPRRAQLFNRQQADRFNQFLGNLQVTGYKPADEPGIRTTQKYWAVSLAGVWARSPYLHNGSVRTLKQLLSKPATRAQTFHKGTRIFEPQDVGYRDEGIYVLDTRTEGNSNAGHDYGTTLSEREKQDLIEHLKTL